MIIGLIALLISFINSVAIFKKKKPTTNKVVESIGVNPTTTIEGNVVEQLRTSFTETPRFPMIFGHRGEKIVELQKLIKKVDPNALPKYGCDGNFDNETCDALNRLIGQGFIKDESDLQKLKDLLNEK
jgi:hypothetical protein